MTILNLWIAGLIGGAAVWALAIFWRIHAGRRAASTQPLSSDPSPASIAASRMREMRAPAAGTIDDGDASATDADQQAVRE